MAKKQIRVTKEDDFKAELSKNINKKTTIVKTDRSAIFVTILEARSDNVLVLSPTGKKTSLPYQEIDEIIIDLKL